MSADRLALSMAWCPPTKHALTALPWCWLRAPACLRWMANPMLSSALGETIPLLEGRDGEPPPAGSGLPMAFIRTAPHFHDDGLRPVEFHFQTTHYLNDDCDFSSEVRHGQRAGRSTV